MKKLFENLQLLVNVSGKLNSSASIVSSASSDIIHPRQEINVKFRTAKEVAAPRNKERVGDDLFKKSQRETLSYLKR